MVTSGEKNNHAKEVPFYLGLEEEDDPYAYYMAESAFVEATISDDDRDFEVRYLSYADGCNTIQDLYNPHKFESNTRIRFMKWIQRQLDAIKKEDARLHSAAEEEFWNDSFFAYHNVREMYTAWKLATKHG
jgi:hypothetical protein